MDPLSITTAVVGLLTAVPAVVCTVSDFIDGVMDAPHQAVLILQESKEFEIILSQLQFFLLQRTAKNSARSERILIEQVILTLTGSVLTFSELQQVLDGLKTSKNQTLLDRVKWVQKESQLERIIQRLQNHKASLGCMLNIMNVQSLNDVHESVTHLAGLVEQVLSSNEDLLRRMGDYDVKRYGICTTQPLSNKRNSSSLTQGWAEQAEALGYNVPMTREAQAIYSCREDSLERPQLSGRVATTDKSDTKRTKNRLSISSTSRELFNFVFENDLKASRVYRKITFRQSELSLPSIERHSASWSIFSGLSISEISNISVVALPLLQSELFNADQYKPRIGKIEKESVERKILLLGIGKSGKSTLLKSMRLLWSHGEFGLRELEKWKVIIRGNFYTTANCIMEKMESIELPYESFKEDNRVQLMNVDVSDCKDPFESIDSNINVVCALENLWKDAAVQKVFNSPTKSPKELTFGGHEAYFFESLRRISRQDYVPSNSDILFARSQTTSITETKFKFPHETYYVYDHGGVRSGRKWWVHTFENVNLVVFSVDIAGFNEVVFENRYTDCMKESLLLFQSISRCLWFKKTCIILLFTKIDKLSHSKLKTSPLENTFPDYTGGCDIEAAKAYIIEKFVALVPKHHQPLCVGITSIVESDRSMAQVVSKGMDYLMNDPKTIHTGHENASYFIMGEDGIPSYY